MPEEYQKEDSIEEVVPCADQFHRYNAYSLAYAKSISRVYFDSPNISIDQVIITNATENRIKTV
jgi:hypothetical protein